MYENTVASNGFKGNLDRYCEVRSKRRIKVLSERFTLPRPHYT